MGGSATPGKNKAEFFLPNSQISAHSKSLKEMAQSIDQLNEENVRTLEKLPKNQDGLLDLVQDYIADAFGISDACDALTVCLDGAHGIRLILQTAVEDGSGPITEENSASRKEKLSRAWQKLMEIHGGEDPFTKFSKTVQKVQEQHQTVLKKLEVLGKDIKSKLGCLEQWHMASRIILITASVLVLTCAVVVALAIPPTSTLILSLAAVVLAFFQILQDWYEKLFEYCKGDLEKKQQLIRSIEERALNALRKLNEIGEKVEMLKEEYHDQCGDFKLQEAEDEFEEIMKRMENFAGTLEDLGQLANDLEKALLKI